VIARAGREPIPGPAARCRTISFADSKRFTELLGTVSESTVEQIDMALRAALNL
jgi:mRNA-degrading endonuclease toxin of MazEF toxin-antitoxin module